MVYHLLVLEEARRNVPSFPRCPAVNNVLVRCPFLGSCHFIHWISQNFASTAFARFDEFESVLLRQELLRVNTQFHHPRYKKSTPHRSELIRIAMRTADYTVPARFVVTLGHILAIVMAMYTLSDNVETTIGVSESLTNADLVASTTTSAQITLYISLGTALFNIFGLISGISMFQGSVNVAHILLHFLGSLYTSWFIMYQWNVRTLWYIWVPFGLFPFLIELSVILRVMCCKADLY